MYAFWCDAVLRHGPRHLFLGVRFYRANSPFKLFLAQEKFEPSESVRLDRPLVRRRKSFTSKASAGIRRKDEEEKIEKMIEIGRWKKWSSPEALTE